MSQLAHHCQMTRFVAMYITVFLIFLAARKHLQYADASELCLHGTGDKGDKGDQGEPCIQPTDYEGYTNHTFTFTSAMWVDGSRNATLKVVRYGELVVVTFPSVLQKTIDLISDTIVITPPLPLRFLPDISGTNITVTSTGDNQVTFRFSARISVLHLNSFRNDGTLIISTTFNGTECVHGQMEVFADELGGSFSGNGGDALSGIYASSAHWVRGALNGEIVS
jgi:hypothetical protein